MSERTLQALRDRINARLQTSAISRDRASAAGREVVAQCRQSDVETLEWVLSEIDAVLATPEPGIALLRTPRGEGEAVRLLGLAMERAELLCRDAGRAEWPLSDFGRDMLQARLDTVRDLIGDALAALRPEAQGELTILDRLQQEINEIASDDLLNVVALDALTTLASRMGFDANGSFPIGRHPSLVDASRPGWLTTPTNGGSDVR